MGYWDFAPPSGHHSKKPLTKRQIQALQKSYEQWDMIVEHVKELEKEELKRAQKRIEDDLDSAFI